MYTRHDTIRYNNNNIINNLTIALVSRLQHNASVSPRGQSRPRTTDPEDSEALVHVFSEWGVAQGLGSPSRSFGDNPQDIFPGMTLRIVNEENTSYKPSRHPGKNYTRRYPSRVLTINSPTTSRETHHWESSGTRDLLRCRGNSSNREHLILSEGKIPRVGSPLWTHTTTGGVTDFIFPVHGLGPFHPWAAIGGPPSSHGELPGAR
ncbi:hypothetical protein LguiA_032007 [Lonicera macranthoides]